MIEIRQLVQFVTVADQKSFRGAARKLNMSQPPLTVSIQKLEYSLKARLFDRSARNVVLTPLGEEIYHRAKFIVDGYDDFIAWAGSLCSDRKRTIRIGFLPILSDHIIPSLIKGFQEQFPHVELSLIEATTNQQKLLMSEDSIDIGIGIIDADLTRNDISSSTIFSDVLAAALPVSHALASRTSLSLSDLEAELWIIPSMSNSPSFTSSILNACEVSQCQPRIVHYATQLQTLLGLVGKGMGISFVPSAMPIAHDNVKVVPLEGEGTPILYILSLIYINSKLAVVREFKEFVLKGGAATAG